MSTLLPRHHSKSFSREGFKPIPPEYEGSMGNNDATIDIPLEQVPSNGGAGLRTVGSSTGLQSNTMDASQGHKKAWFRGRRHKPDPYRREKGKVGYDGEEETVNTMGVIYRKILNFSTITRYFFYVLPLALLIAAPIIVTSFSNGPNDNHPKIGGVRIIWFFTWVEIVWLSLWGSKTIAHYLPQIFQALAGVVSSGVRKYSMVIRALEIPLSLVGWAVTSLATFKPLMTKNPNFIADCVRDLPQDESDNCLAHYDWINIVQKILAATVIAALVYLGEKTIIQLISINYHRKQFNSRIKESKHNIWILGLLYDASRALFPMYCNEFAEEDYVIADQLDLSRRSHSRKASNRKSGSHTPIRIIQDIGHVTDKITSAFGHVAQEITGKQVFNPNSAHSIVIEALEKNRTAEALARRIWMSFVLEGRDALYEEDIADVLGPDRKAEAEEAFWTFDQDQNGDVSLDEFILTVTQYGRDRKSIASSMHDVDQAINVLDKMLGIVVLIVVVLVYVAFLNASFVSTLATTGTALISLSFVFSVTAQEILGSCIFLFVKHPFDIGDRVDIGSVACTNQEHFVVEHISLLFCVYRHVQGPFVGRLCQIPNIVSNTYWINNLSRSKAMTEQLTMDIAFDTSFDDLQILKNEMVKFVTDKENSRDFQPTVDLDVLGTSDQSKLSLLVEVKHKSNWANETIRRARRSKFMCALVSAMKTVPIYPPGGGCDTLGSAALPSYTVAISQSEAKEYAEAAEKDREKARLVPKKKVEESRLGLATLSPTRSRDEQFGSGMMKSDTKVAEGLTNRNPSVDPARDEIWGHSDNSSSTLGERPSVDRPSVDRPDIDRADLDEVRGMLRRESTRGKRKASQDYAPNIPTINEPGSLSMYPSTSYASQASATASGYENQRPGYTAPPGLYRAPTGPPPPAQYLPELEHSPTLGPVGDNVEMSQLPHPSRSPSNPYRGNNGNRPHLPRIESEKEWDGRPYSGV